MATELRQSTDETRLIEERLRAIFFHTEAYRYNLGSIRVRVIDDRFIGKSQRERDEMVLPLVRELPDEVQADIMILLLLAPDEQGTSMMNVEFEHPSPSML